MFQKPSVGHRFFFRSAGFRQTFTVSFLAPLLLLGCEGLSSEKLPYTPFAVQDGSEAQLPDKKPLAPFEPLPQKRMRTIPYQASLAPPRTARWTIEGRTLLAPEGLIFRLGLPAELKGGQPEDVVAWMVGGDATASNGELWLYPETGKPRQIASFPGFVPAGPGCRHGTRLTRTGPSTVTLDVLATCEGNLLPRSPVRSLEVFAPLRSKPEVASFRIAAAAANETLGFDLDTRDLDNDGRDDITLTIGLKSTTSTGTAIAAKARLQWIDRTAGLSRDTAEPRQSFAQLAAKISQAASSGQSPTQVSNQIAAARRLYSTLCVESGTPRLFDSNGEGLTCGPLTTAFESFTGASVRASLTAGFPTKALVALEQHSWFGNRQTKKARRFQAKLLTQISKKLALRRVVKLVPLKSQPIETGELPHYSPLSFHADGSLLMLTADGVVRSAPDGRYEYNASHELDPWNTAVLSPRGNRLTGIAYPCGGAEVSILQTSVNGASLPALLTAWLAPRPGNCNGLSPEKSPALAIVGWNGRLPTISIGTAAVGAAIARPPLGSARSPNGRFTMVPTPYGLLVKGGQKPALWKFEDPALPLQLKDCVVSNNAQAAACLLQGRAYVILPDPKSSPN